MSQPKSVLETLVAARKRIDMPENWTQKVVARNAANRKVRANSPVAVKWCAYGAIDASAGEDWLLASRAVSRLGRSINSFLVGEYNDTHTHAEVLRAFDVAIEKAREESL